MGLRDRYGFASDMPCVLMPQRSATCQGVSLDSDRAADRVTPGHAERKVRSLSGFGLELTCLSGGTVACELVVRNLV